MNRKSLDVTLQDIKDFFTVVKDNSSDVLEKVKALVDKGVDVNTIDDNKRNVLFYMNLKRDSKFNHELFKYFKSRAININQPDINNKNALMHCKKPCFDAVKAFVNAGLNIEKQDNNGNTLLFYVRDTKIVRFLIDQVVNVNHENKKGENALYVHRYYKHSTYSLIALINAGAKLNKCFFDLDPSWFDGVLKLRKAILLSDKCEHYSGEHYINEWKICV